MTAPMSERDLQAAVVDLARLNGVLAYHTHDSRRSTPGFPDLVLCHPRSHRVLFIELKTDGGRLTDEQRTWLAALRGFVWRPADLRDGIVAHAIRQLAWAPTRGGAL